MKKTLLLAITATGISLASYGQINKGTVLLGGSIGAASNKYEQGNSKQKNNFLVLSPAAGLAIRTNMVAGLRLSYGRTTSKNDPPNSFSAKTTTYGGGLFLRHYKPLGKSFYLYGEAAASYDYNEQVQYGTVEAVNKLNSVSLALTPGLTYAVGRRIHLEASINNIVSLGYISGKSYTTNPASSVTKQTSFGFNTNFSASNPLSLGIRLVLGK